MIRLGLPAILIYNYIYNMIIVQNVCAIQLLMYYGLQVGLSVYAHWWNKTDCHLVYFQPYADKIIIIIYLYNLLLGVV